MHSVSEQRITVPSQRGTKSLSQTFSLTVPIWWNDLPNSIRAAESLPIFKKRLKTHFFHLYLTLTLALSILILFYLIYLLFIKKKHTHLTLYQLHIYSLTASFSCKTNTEFIFFYILYTRFLLKNNLPTLGKPGLVIALAYCCSFVGFDCLYNVLICKSLWIKASAKWLNDDNNNNNNNNLFYSITGLEINFFYLVALVLLTLKS